MEIMTMIVQSKTGTIKQEFQIPKEKFVMGQLIDNHPRVDGKFIVKFFDPVVVMIEEIESQ